jgi:hypothetical protein
VAGNGKRSDQIPQAGRSGAEEIPATARSHWTAIVDKKLKKTMGHKDNPF